MKKILMILLIHIISFFGTVAFAEESAKVTLNGEIVQFDRPPVIVDDILLAPIDTVAEKLGAEFQWNENTRTATVHYDNKDIGVALEIDNPIMTVRTLSTKKEKPTNLEVSPKECDGVRLFPLQAFVEALGCSVSWDDSNKTMNIVTIDIKNNGVITPTPLPTPYENKPRSFYRTLTADEESKEVEIVIADSYKVQVSFSQDASCYWDISVSGSNKPLYYKNNVTANEINKNFSVYLSEGIYILKVEKITDMYASFNIIFNYEKYIDAYEKEPNDTIGMATKINLHKSVTGNLGHYGDVDFYRFELVNHDYVSYSFIHNSDRLNTSPYWVVSLCDSNLNEIRDSKNIIKGNEGMIFSYKILLPAGTYYVKINQSSYTNTDYSLKVSNER